ncbi:hypothetical protein AVL50_20145 [Flammeovirga sp. SJP92]|nr:hypothetical protein AVL50_20145 [Flammeovirga sp. SJP92]
MLVGFGTNNNLSQLSLGSYVDSDTLQMYESGEISTINEEEVIVLNAVDIQTNTIFLEYFGVKTVEELAIFKPFVEAKTLIQDEIDQHFKERPSAPKALIPQLIGSTHTTARFSNYVRENGQELKGTVLTDAYLFEKGSAKELKEIFCRTNFKYNFGYLAAFKQRWINAGTHLGEVLHSLALAPGESRNIAFIEWNTRQSSARQEDSEASERLNSEFLQHRALNEVVKSTAQEHLHGETEIDATTKTSGFGLTLGFGGGRSSGASAKADLTAVTGIPMEVAGAGLNAMAGSTGASFVRSKSSVQGILKSETTGERSVSGEVMQDISDSTIQNSSNIRSLMSTVVVEDEQSGSQKTYTRNVTNYNHSHALTIQYFEVLQKYEINTYCDGLTPVLYLPFEPLDFDIELIKKYWPTLKEGVRASVTRAKYHRYNALISDFKAENGDFTISDDVRITKVKIVTSCFFGNGVRVALDDAKPPVTLKVTKGDMDECMNFKLNGSSNYIDYELFENLTKTFNGFDRKDSFKIGENVTVSLKSRFKKELKKQLIRYLENSNLTPKVLEIEMEDNDLGIGHKRTNLKHMVDDDNYRLVNPDEEIDFTINLDYTLEDTSGNQEVVSQTYSDSLSFANLHNGYDEVVFNVTDHINKQLQDVSDINPRNEIDELEAYFRTNKYGFTKYLLTYMEKEQVIDIIEQLVLDGNQSTIPLTSIIDPNPLGIVENLMIFKLKEPNLTQLYSVGDKFTFIAQHSSTDTELKVPLVGYGVKKEVLKKGRKYTHYHLVTENRVGILNTNVSNNKPTFEYDVTISNLPNENKKFEFVGEVTTKITIKGVTTSFSKAIQGETAKNELKHLILTYELHSTEGQDNNETNDDPIGQPKISNITFNGRFFFLPTKNSDIKDVVNAYLKELKVYEEEVKKTSVKGTVFLPTSGVFAEAILGVSNASEYIDISRFYNWQDSPIPNAAPQIGTLNANYDYSKPVSDQLQPNVPVSVLNQISPNQMPGTSLDTALGAVQNGSMFRDMSKTDQFMGALGDLANLANNTAQLAGNLSGEAAANALNAAVELGKQVAGMVNTAMGNNIAPAPSTPTEKGGAINKIKEMKPKQDGSLNPRNKAIANSTGTPVPQTSTIQDPPPTPGKTTPSSPTVDEIVLEDNLEIKTNSIHYTPPVSLVGHIKSVILDDLLQFGDLMDLFSSIEKHVQYGGMLNITGNIKLTSKGVAKKRTFNMAGITIALRLNNIAGGDSQWNDFNIDQEIDFIEELNSTYYEVIFISGDLSEIINTISDVTGLMSNSVDMIEGFPIVPDLSILPDVVKDWIDDSTFLDKIEEVVTKIKSNIATLENIQHMIQNELRASGLFIKGINDNNWTFISEVNNTIGTCFATSFITNHNMTMKVLVE